MKNSNGIKKIVSLIKHILPKEGYEKVGIRPWKDWYIILLVFTLGLFVCGAYAFYVNFNVREANFWTVNVMDQSVPVYKINQNNLDTVTDYFNQKEKNLNDAQSNPKIPSDPSL